MVEEETAINSDVMDTRIIILDPPQTDQSSNGQLPDGTPTRLVTLTTCPLCLDDFEIVNCKPLYCDYHGREKMVAVCPTCSGNPPEGYEDALVRAIDTYPMSRLSR